MRVSVAILLLALLPAAPAAPARPSAPTPEATADSLYDARAIDSLLAFSERMIRRAAAAHDSTRLGRMTYHRGRARLALRDLRAEADFDHAIAIAEAVDDSVGRMHALGLKAFVAVNQGRLDESIRLNEERNRLARLLGHPGAEGWGHLLIGYAELHRENFTRARTEYEEAWRDFAVVERPGLQLSALVGLGRVLDRMGRYDEARTSYQHAWLTARELADTAQEADAINNLGVIEYEHGELSQAAHYFTRAYELKRDTGAFDTATAARNVAMVDLIIGRYAHAESTLVEVLSTPEPNALGGAVEIELGRIRIAQGRPRGATAYFRRVIADSTDQSIKPRVEAATFLSEALADLDSVTAALDVMNRTVGVLMPLGPSTWRADAFLEWGRRLRDTGSPDQARGAMKRAWDDAAARDDSLLLVVTAAEMSRCEREMGHDADAFAWLERARAGFEASPMASEFQWREAQRAVLVRALIEGGEVLRTFPVGATPGQRDRALFDFLEQVRSRTFLERVTDPRRFADIEAELARPLLADELQTRVLRAGECFFLATPGPGHIYVFAVTRDHLRAAVIDDPRGALELRMRGYSRLLARAPSARNDAPPHAAARALGSLLFSDVDSLIRSSTRVYAALDGFLSAAPLETLVCPGETEPLLAAHDVVRTPAASFLRYLRERQADAPAAPSILAVASGGGLAGARREVDTLARRYGATRAVDPGRAAFLAALAGHDVIHVASHVRVESERPWHSGILIETASAAAPHAADESGAVPASNPLTLSAADSSELATELPHDPFVRASEISNRRLDARLVVLSGCESALGRATLAEGILGIASSFVCAGARTVVASLWEVDDRTTAEMMARFYRELESGNTVSSALQRSKLAMRARKPHPFFWAGFVVIGDGDVRVHVESRPDRRALLGGTIAITLFIILGWHLWYRRSNRGRLSA